MVILFLLSILIFAITLAAVLYNPWKLGIGVWAVIGAAAGILSGVTSLSDIGIVWNIVGNATLTFVSIIIITLIFDEAGYFEFIALKLSSRFGESSFRAFVIFLLLDAVVGALFANDGAALVMTPVIISFLKKSGLGKKTWMAFIMSVGFVADSSSLPLVTSNLVNIVSATYFSISYTTYFLHMVLPYVVSVFSSIGVLILIYRKDIRGRLNREIIEDPRSVIKDRLIFLLASPVIIIMIVAYSVTGFYGIQVAYVAVPSMIAILLLYSQRHFANSKKILKEAPWQVVFFSLGMYLIVFGMSQAGLQSILTGVIAYLHGPGGLIGTVLPGYLFATMAAFMNNMPSVMLGSIAIAHTSYNSSLIYANVIGNDIGPKFTPIGSLATLLWIYSVKRKSGIVINARYYMKIGLISALPVLTFTLAVLMLI